MPLSPERTPDQCRCSPLVDGPDPKCPTHGPARLTDVKIEDTAVDPARPPLGTLREFAQGGWVSPPAVRRPTDDYARDVTRDAIALFTGERNADYGDATDNFTDIADLWSVVLRPILRPGAVINAEQAAIMQALIKVARLNNTPHHDDSWVDATAYLALGGGIHRRRQS